MQLVEVEVVHAEPPRARLTGTAHVVRARARGAVRHAPTELGCHDRLVPALPQRATQRLLRGAAAVDIGGVEQVDALIEGGVHDLDAAVSVKAATEARKLEVWSNWTSSLVLGRKVVRLASVRSPKQPWETAAASQSRAS